MSILASIKSYLPNDIRKFIFRLRNFGLGYAAPESLDSLRRKLNFYFSLPFTNRKKYKAELDFLKNEASDLNSVVFPYRFVQKYKVSDVVVEKDASNGLFYVLHKGHRLYYSSRFATKESVAINYSSISMEQDHDSPHRYLTTDFNIKPGDIVVDLGAAEGNFSLEVVEKAGRLYIIEADPEWIPALEASFAPWKDKVTIINRYVTNRTEGSNITLKDILGGQSPNFLKLDVEGAEISVLSDSFDVLEKSKDLKIAVCTYHRQKDAEKIEEILRRSKFRIDYSNGFMLFVYDSLRPPYFRKNLIRACK